MRQFFKLATFIVRFNQQNHLNFIRSRLLHIKSHNPQTTKKSSIFSNIAFSSAFFSNIALSRAIRYGNKTQIIRQLKSKLDPNSRHVLYSTPLHVGAENHQSCILVNKIFLENGLILREEFVKIYQTTPEERIPSIDDEDDDDEDFSSNWNFKTKLLQYCWASE